MKQTNAFQLTPYLPDIYQHIKWQRKMLLYITDQKKKIFYLKSKGSSSEKLKILHLRGVGLIFLVAHNCIFS